MAKSVCAGCGEFRPGSGRWCSLLKAIQGGLRAKSFCTVHVGDDETKYCMYDTLLYALASDETHHIVYCIGSDEAR